MKEQFHYISHLHLSENYFIRIVTSAGGMRGGRSHGKNMSLTSHCNGYKNGQNKRVN